MVNRESTFAAIRWTALTTLGKAALQFAQLVVLARLLAPEDFGLMAIVLAIVFFLQGLADLGVSSAIIHHHDASDYELSSLYWLNLVVSVIMSFLIAICSPYVSLFYDDSRLVSMLAFSSLVLILNAVGQQLRVKAERALNFGPLALIELVSAVLGFGASTLVAIITKSPFALVVGLLSSAFVLMVLSWGFLSFGWRPILTFCWSDMRRLISFGGYASLSNVVGTINMQMDVVIGGRLFGALELGVYSVARDLCLKLSVITNPIATRVGFPLMAQDHLNKQHVKHVYCRTLQILAALNSPLYLGVAFFSADIVQVFLGSRWVMAVPVIRFLALWGLLRSMINPVGSLLYACGRARESFCWNLSLLILGLPVVTIGAQWGSEGLAIAQFLYMLSLFMLAWKYLVKPDTEISAKEYLKILLLPLALSVITVSICWLVVMPLIQSDIRLVIAITSSIVIYMGLSWYWNRGWINALRALAGQTL